MFDSGGQAIDAFTANIARFRPVMDIQNDYGVAAREHGRALLARGWQLKSEAMIFKAWKGANRKSVVERQLRALSDHKIKPEETMHMVLWAAIRDALASSTT